MAKISVFQEIDFYCDICKTPLEAYQDAKNQKISIAPCSGCAKKYKDAMNNMVKRLEVAA